jgi:hypothetical protein
MSSSDKPQKASPLTIKVTQDLRRTLEGEPSVERLVLSLRHLAKWRAHLLAETLKVRSGDEVLSGPFKGMRYGVRASEGTRVARLIGAYEACLAPVIEKIVARAYPLVIDVGSAEGYYAVGLARRMPGSRVLARDDNPFAQRLCAELAAQNGVADRIEIAGQMTHEDFQICKAQDTVVICDIEGAEAELLDPSRARGLRHADILVEVHELMRPGLVQTISARFARTHNVTRIDRRLDDSGMPDWMHDLSDMDRMLALWEWRAGPTPWLWMTRK